MSESVLLADDHPVDPDDEVLVAYLDGELDDDERASVEKRLVGEIAFRQRLQTLQTGWEWLDDLPDVSSNEKFVESTIELVVADIMPTKANQASWIRRNWKAVAFTVLMLGGLLTGAIGTTVAKRIALKRDLEELAIAEDHQAYSLGPNFSLYYALLYNPRWQAMVKMMEKVGGRSIARPSVVRGIPLEEREDVIQSLPTEERARLVGRWETYNGYGEETKNRIRQTARKVLEQDDREALLRTMKAASVWLEGLSEELRDDLQSDNENIRSQAIDDAIGITLANLARDSGKLISEETSDQIYLWLRVLYRNRVEALPMLAERIESLKTSVRNEGRSEQWVDYLMLRMMVDDRGMRFRGGGFGSTRSFGSGYFRPGGPGPGGPGPPRSPELRQSGSDRTEPEPERPMGPIRIPRISDEELEELTNVLGAEALADLATLTSLTTSLVGEVAVSETLRDWAAESVKRNRPPSDSGETTPLDRYRELEDRDLLELGSPDELVNEVYSRPGRRGGSRER